MFLRMKHIVVGRIATLLVAVAFAACVHRLSLLNSGDPRFAAAAPDSFDVEMITTKGPLVVRVWRAWSPHGTDRFHTLVEHHFFDGVAFHRVIRNFVAQFGISGDPAIAAAWNGRTMPDDTVRAPNQRGTLAFARGGAVRRVGRGL